MNLMTRTHRVWFRVLATIGIVFGLLTLREGGSVLLGDDAARLAAGNYVPFVVWFNFLAGFVYIITGTGLAFRQPWAVRTALLIALATLVVFAALGMHIVSGGVFEMRTVFAMTFRSLTWFIITVIAWRILRRELKQSKATTE